MLIAKPSHLKAMAKPRDQDERKKALTNEFGSVFAKFLNDITNSHTRYVYSSAIRDFKRLYPKLTGKKLIEEAEQDEKRGRLERKRIVAQRIKDFYNDLKKKGRADNAALTFSSALRSFYSAYDFKVVLKGSNKLPHPKKTNHRIQLNAFQVKTLTDHATSPRDRAIIWILFQGMFDASTICSLNYFNVKQSLQSSEYPFCIRELVRPKTSVSYYTFILKESVDALKAYLADCKARRITFNDSTPLFLKKQGKRMTENLIQIMLSEVAQKAGFVDGAKNGNTQNPLSPHSLRESGTSLLANSGMPDSTTLFLSGHEVGSIAEAYLGVQFESVRKMYLEREKILGVQVGEVVNDERIEQLEKKLEQVERRLDVSRKGQLMLAKMLSKIARGKAHFKKGDIGLFYEEEKTPNSPS